MGRWLRMAMVALALALGGGVFYVLTSPSRLPATALPGHEPDIANGEYMFHAGGCASCHAAPASEKCNDPRIADPAILAGGRCLKSPFGTFTVPNISPDPQTGIGGWSTLDFINAMTRGVSPDGRHYYPAFPYASYQRMTFQDLMDLKAYLDTLAPVRAQRPGHDLPLIFRWRRSLGLWKWLYLDGRPFAPDPSRPPEINRGAYLVTGPGHCGECHTPRDALGGMIESAALSGAPALEGGGFVPNITPDASGLKSWSEADIAYALESGFTPDFDTLGGAMTKVQEDMANLSAEDRAAIAAYLKSVPPIARERPKPQE